jgi:DNA-directed RNA polymerase specialized sigma24 family protein
MTEHRWLTERFEENRLRLRGVAYRMLGSLSEAEDAVQEAWLRLNGIDAATIENLGGWLTTVVSRVCLDMLRGRKARREESIEAQVTEPSVVRGEGALNVCPSAWSRWNANLTTSRERWTGWEHRVREFVCRSKRMALTWACSSNGSR